jgi:peptidoglycan/LPS O-acetylase OafA/YrhL
MDRIDELEGARGLMAWWVVAGHLIYFISNKWGDFLSDKSAVHVFIILSGFVIFFLLDKNSETYEIFLTRRFFRLFPAYLIVLIVSTATLELQRRGLAESPIFDHSVRNLSRLKLFDSTIQHLGAQFAAHITMLHGVIPESVVPSVDLGIIGQAWSISVEWQFYICAPMLLLLFEGRGKKFYLALLGTIFLLCMHWIPSLRGNSAFLAPSLPWFAVGILSFFVWKKRGDVRFIRNHGYWLIGILLIVSVFMKSPGMIFWSLMLLIFLGPNTKLTVAVKRILNSRAMQYLGRISYSTYLVHMLPLYLGMYLINGLRLNVVEYISLLFSITILFALVLSVLLHRYVEKPGMELGKYVARRRAASLLSSQLRRES